MILVVVLSLILIPLICIFIASGRISREEERREMEEILNDKEKNN